ncbi:hypothetical protein ACFL60_05505 [Candidatus Omnitrophota bacterium]
MIKRILFLVTIVLLLRTAGLSYSQDNSATQEKTTADPLSLQNSSIPFYIGIADSNSIIIPFAVYANKAWSAPWPVKWYNISANEMPKNMYKSLGDIPESWYKPLADIPTLWHYSDIKGNPEVLNISRLELVSCYCRERWAMVADTTKKTDVRRSGDYYRLSNTVFMVTSSHQFARNSETIQENSDEMYDIRTFLEPLFDKAEDNANHPKDSAVRSSTTMKFMNAVRNSSPHDGRLYYYIEATKKYPGPGNLSTHFLSYMNGWIVRNSEGTFSFLKQEFHVYSNEMYLVSGDLVLGTIIIDDNMYWIIIDRGYEGESYVLLQVSRDGVNRLLSISGGGC